MTRTVWISAVALISTLAGWARADVPLRKPAMGEARGFYADEVGICAYVRIEEGIDVAKFKYKLRQIEEIGEDYVIGTKDAPGFPEEKWPYVYANSEGWVIAYYTRGKPTSYIVQGGYWYSNDFVDQLGLYKIVKALVPSEYHEKIRFYHFGYPEATDMLVAMEEKEYQRDYFYITIPGTVTVYDITWAFYNYHSSYDSSWVKIDGRTIVDAEEWPLFGTIEELEPDKEHTVEVRDSRFYMVVLYRKP